MMSEGILILVAIAYSAAVTAIGRRFPRPASITAYGTALVILIAVPLLPDPIAQRVDRVVQMVGAGRLLVHLGFMTVLCGIFLTLALATNRWTWRQQLTLGGAGVLTVLFVVLWWYVRTLPLPEMTSLFYGIRAGRPPPMLWMNVVMGAGIVYIAVCGLVEFQYFLRVARSTYERVVVGVVSALYVLASVAGTLTIVEAVGRHHGADMTVVHQVKTPFTASVLTLNAMLLVGQIWLWPLWRHRRLLLVRYLEPDLVQLRNDLLNLSAAEAERHLDLHQEAYANRAVVEEVAARCRAAGIAPARSAMARMAVSLLTLQRDNVLQDPSYGLVTSWDALREDAAAEIDQAMAATAWEQALRDSYISQQVYIIVFLVLESPAYREILLVNERPQIQAWHQHLADIIAAVMHEHGHATPRAVALAQGSTSGNRVARLCARLASGWGRVASGMDRAAQDGVGQEDDHTSTR
jgi:hypothetical protein